MKVSELCKMIEDSIHSGRYPFTSETEKQFAQQVRVENRSGSDDLKSENIQVEVRVKELYVLINYVPHIQHLPGVVELDVLDSFKMICRKIDRIDTKGMTSIKKM